MNWHVVNVFAMVVLCVLAYLFCRYSYRDQIRDLKDWLQTERRRREQAEERVQQLTEVLYRKTQKRVSRWN